MPPIQITAVGFVALVVAGLATAFWYFGDLPFWLAVALALGGITFNGLVAMLEDDLPGGINNPDGSDTPR